MRADAADGDVVRLAGVEVAEQQAADVDLGEAVRAEVEVAEAVAADRDVTVAAVGVESVGRAGGPVAVRSADRYSL